MSGAEQAFVYVMARSLDDGWSYPCKVGLAANPRGRLPAIRTACPFPLGLYATIGPLDRDAAADLEGDFHAIKANYRMHGEWFQMDPDEALFVLVQLRAFFSTGEAASVAASFIRVTLDSVWCADIDVHQGYAAA